MVPLHTSVTSQGNEGSKVMQVISSCQWALHICRCFAVPNPTHRCWRSYTKSPLEKNRYISLLYQCFSTQSSGATRQPTCWEGAKLWTGWAFPRTGLGNIVSYKWQSSPTSVKSIRRYWNVRSWPASGRGCRGHKRWGHHGEGTRPLRAQVLQVRDRVRQQTQGSEDPHAGKLQWQGPEATLTWISQSFSTFIHEKDNSQHSQCSVFQFTTDKQYSIPGHRRSTSLTHAHKLIKIYIEKAATTTLSWFSM